MKRFFLLLVVAAIAGSATGWGINYTRYGHRTAHFGEIGYQGEITAENYQDHLDKLVQVKNPQVELPEGAEYDFGAMAPNDTGEHTFIVKNVGEGDLTLRLGATTCKCTLGSLKTDRLKPGEQTEVLLEWNVKTDSSTFGQSAQVLTNDPNHYAIDFRVNGRVVREMEMVPEEFTFGEVAAKENIELTSKIYSYLLPRIEDPELRFTSDALNELAEVTIEPFEPSEADGANAKAVQAFDISIKIKPGLRQGPLSQNAILSFRHRGEGETLDQGLADAGDGETGEKGMKKAFTAAIVGKVVGSISMIPNPRLTVTDAGNYVYDFGVVKQEDQRKAKTFVVLKGANREHEKLSVQSVVPEDVVRAKFGDPIQRATMTLYPLEIELQPGAERTKRLARDRDDYGKVRIVSDAPDGDKLTIGLTFSLEPI
ncbi:DUF1573 domain-containing protein [Novipirellula artificiosorum]|uniref:DUF1573 domain-containing protein n=1 Tax=Novipirellula artificiosorum TaxID=2528016 RepID=A0A5C6D4I5_9BACT|nr:DUF1573 domain-containing protein [Novipirellula artificiosorum]TWU31720.1 hypothetical protein Poly41_59540 [Novipirellula artificiosorum]